MSRLFDRDYHSMREWYEVNRPKQVRRVWVNPFYSNEFGNFWLITDIEVLIQECREIKNLMRTFQTYRDMLGFIGIC